ncbi:hypothetical protein [Streptomyces zagrosensis]|uniref:Peptidoglycan binding domain-containing protein n=1 Tax=Streptomyces zagrosensis TaxID=1042984 RepID=A0A7W9UZH7_9ACTN|nr:hypothetical protein [Streptomyces zagrosensis]MBB5936752.1 hypothetical protein [Streptomyces zagrosensis]
MSRESDSSSSGPQGRGDAAYPSGTPPYGSRQYPSPHPTQEAPYDNADGDSPEAPPAPAEPKTETTLTTRIRINIPGSRPIPPVVVRKTVNEKDSADSAVPLPGSGSGSGSASGQPGGPGRGGQRSGGTKDGGKGGPRPGGPASGTGGPGDSLPGAGAGKGAGPGSLASAVAPTGGTASGSGSLSGPGEIARSDDPQRKGGERTSDWFAPRKGKGPQGQAVPTPQNTPTGTVAPIPGPTQTPETTQETTQPFPMFGAEDLPGDGHPGDEGFAGHPGYSDRADQPGAGGYAGPDGHGEQDSFGGPGGIAGRDAFGGQDGPGGPGTGGGPSMGGGQPGDQPYFPDYAEGQYGAGPGGGQGDPLTDRLPDPLTDPLGTFPGSSPPPGAGGPELGGPGFPTGPAEPTGFPYEDRMERTQTPPDGFPSPWLSGSGSAHPAAPTGGPVTGDMPVPPPDSLPGHTPSPGAAPGFDTSGGPGGPFAGPGGSGAPFAGPGGPGGEPFDSSGGLDDPFRGPAGPGGDTARLTPQHPRQGSPGTPTHGGPAESPLPDDPELTESERAAKAALDALASGKKPSSPPVSGNTLVSGAPVAAPPRPQATKPAAPGGDSTPPTAPAPAPSGGGGGGGKAKKKKGRSKLVMAGVGVIGVACVAYGAGLVLGHTDVPNGTTVLGIDIGGTSKEEAVKKLDTQLGNRTTAPIKVSVDGEQLELKPSVAGLSIDTEATVRDTAGRDYNPVTVIGSLFGGTREADAKVTVDEEKLRDALGRLAGDGAGAAREGNITFEPGKAVPVYGKAGKSLDAKKSVEAVAQAYRDRAETGANRAVVLPSVTKQPKISNADVDQKMETFAEPAMSGLITVLAGNQRIQFGPDRSLPQILSMREVDGQLVVHYDLDAIRQLYGSTFQGVLVERGDGSKTPVKPTDVASAMGRALVGKTPTERIVTIPNTVLG